MSRQERRSRSYQSTEGREEGTPVTEPVETLSALQLVTTPRPFFTEQLKSLDRAGVESTTLTVPGTSRSRSVTDFLRYYPRVLERTVGGEQWDVIHANFGLVAPHALAQPSRPVVLSLWGTDLMGRYAEVSKWCAKHCDAVVVMSEGMGELLDTDCHVIPHGVDLKRFEPIAQAQAQADLGWDRTAKHVLFPYGPDREVKNFSRAAAVVERARKRFDGPIELHVVQGVSHDTIPTYMNAADSLLITSHREGSPNAVKEALACNLPVVSTDVGDVPERLDGVYPSYICETDEDLASALTTVFAHDSRSNGRETVEDVSLERMGERLRAVYESVGAGQ
jgi:glycosyltransferase involved in cell wall biosynthesis